MTKKPISDLCVLVGVKPWLPPSLRHRKRDVEIRFRMSRAERIAYRKRKPVRPSVWAERHRIVTRGPFQGVRWQNRVTPYLRGIMDAADHPFVQEIIVCAAPQTGKSAVVDTYVGSRIDRAPGPVLYVYPDEDTATENIRDRIIPMIKESTRLASYLTGTADDESAKRIKLLHMELYMAWARSAAKLGNKSIRYLVFDECDKYPAFANKVEADPFALGEARTTWYQWSRKIWKVSTPTIESGPIWQAITKTAQVRFEFEVQCPACMAMQIMEWKRIVWPDPSPNPETVENDRLAWYECANCRAKWDDNVRNMAVSKGRWVSREEKDDDAGRVVEGGIPLFDYLNRFRPIKIGFHLPSWLSRFVPMSRAAAAFLRGHKDKGKLRDWANNHAAEPWLDFAVERKEDRILALRDERPRGMVPSGGVVSCLTGAVDTQEQGFWFEIRAWGYGMEMESWQIREGFVMDWESITRIMYEDAYYDSDEKNYHVRLVVQDAMGVKGRTAEVYDYARRHRGRHIPYKGEQTMRQPYAFSKIDTVPGTNKPIPGGIQLLRADTTFFKNLLSSKLEIAPADPGAWHLHAETTEEYARHMCAEYVDEKQVWQCRPHHANHLWDCGVLNLVAADILGVKFKARPEKKETGERRQEKGDRPEWIRPPGSGWIRR